MSKPLLRLGSSGEDVLEVERILIDQGYGFGELIDDGDFDEFLEDCVTYFQMTHVKEDGEALDVDGVVGNDTWWALYNHSGAPQRNYYEPYIPQGIGGNREVILKLALAEHGIGVKEEPNGSNWGDGVIKYGGQPGWAWCCLFASWVIKHAMTGYPLGKRFASCYRNWQAANEAGFTKRGNPIPGDQFIMLYTNSKGHLNGKGHTGFVLAVSEDGEWINTIEGNAGNRVKVGKRPTSQIYGYIDWYGRMNEDLPVDWKRGLVGASSTAADTTR